MKVWERIAELNNGQIAFKLNNCPSEVEEKHHIIGEERFNRHCEPRCGVKCYEEYMQLEVKK